MTIRIVIIIIIIIIEAQFCPAPALAWQSAGSSYRPRTGGALQIRPRAAIARSRIQP